MTATHEPRDTFSNLPDTLPAQVAANYPSVPQCIGGLSTREARNV